MKSRPGKAAILFILIPILVSVFLTCPSEASVGFQASFDPIPLFISGYDEQPDEFSAAMYPLSYPIISPKMKHPPHVASSSFETNSLQFETQYYALGSYRQYLVPVSVDADYFLDYRLKKAEQAKFSDLFTSAITNPENRQHRRGLGISVALPKRLDKIFGEGGAGLQVTGYRRITFSGRSQWNDQANTDTFRQSKFPSLNMEQISKFEITGTIGTKISVKVSQDSQTDIPLENRIQIRYKGDDDDILKSIEAGNTNLNLPNTQFVGYSQRIQGLFGLKAEAQVGNLSVTGIMSQEKGSAETSSFTASSESAEYIRDYEYVRNRVFDLFYPDEVPGVFNPDSDNVSVLYVYEQIRDTETDEIAQGFRAKYFVYPDEDRRGEFAGESEQVTVRQIDAQDYEFEDDPVTGLPRLVFRSSRSPSRSIAFYMEIAKGGDPDNKVTVGDISQTSSDTLFLKLLSLNSSGADPSKKSWDLMWRNCYNMPRGVSGQDLDLKVFKGLSGTEHVNNDNLEYQDSGTKTYNYIQILGLDQYNTSSREGADGRLDDQRTEILRSDWGLLIFPNRTPFDNDTTYKNSEPLRVRVPTIYNSREQTKIASSSQYYIQISSRARSSVIRLNRANIIEGSERVVLNGRQLSRGVDYNIMYDFGQITLLSQEALDPNAELHIDFEYAPFLSLQKKTLLGMRLQYEWSEDIKFGSTVLYKSDKAEDRKPRVGQETATMLVTDFDASFRLRPSFLTSAANALPLITTDVPSNLLISAEVAQSHPNPNVDDVAYVDDFESALNQLSIGTTRSNWHLASPPALAIDTSQYYRGRLIWHNPDLSSEIRRVEDVYDREARQGEGTLRTFRMIFNPVRRQDTTIVLGSQGQDSTVVDTTFLPSYGGIMHYVDPSRIDAEKVTLFEFRARVGEGTRAKLHFDFGAITEELYYNNDDLGYANKIGSPFDEDGFSTDPLGGAPNGVVEFSEDVGLDGIPNTLEPEYDKDTLPDPSDDNWFFEGSGLCPLPDSLCAELVDNPDNPLWRDPRFRYLWLNGTEGNLRDNAEPDRERLGTNGFKDDDAYFSYEVDLEHNNFVVEESELNGWKTYRIPVKDSTLYKKITDGNSEASWTGISHVRVWFETDETSPIADTIEIADWYFVQSNWVDTIILDPLSTQYGDNGSKLTVASVSTEDNTFSPPPGVEAYKDPTYNVEEPQRGLLLQFESLQYLDTAMASKELITVDQYSGYRKMRMYVSVEELNNADSIMFFMRIGRDGKNYYEHREMVQQSFSWDKSQYVEIDFNELTALKDKALRAGVRLNEIDTTEGKYRVVGNPNLNEVRMFSVGVVNTDQSFAGKQADVNGRIWLDELRVTDVRKDVGTAGRITTNGSIADLISYNFGYSSKDPYFRSISAATRGGSNNNLGSGQTETSTNYGATFFLHKFLPRSWGANLPLSINIRQTTKIPLLRTNTDIVLPEEVRQAEKSVNSNRSISLNGIKFDHKGHNPLFSLFLNRLQGTSFSYGRSKSQDVRTPYRLGENMSVQSGFDLGVKKPPSLPVFFWTKNIPFIKKTAGAHMYFYPSAWTLRGSYQRSLTIQDNADYQRLTTVSRTFNGSVDLNYKVMDNLTMGYRYATDRDLTDLDLVRIKLNDMKLGLETRYQQTSTASYDPKLFRFFTTSFTYRAGYTEDYDRSYESYRSSLNESHGVNGVFDHHALLGGGSTGGGEQRFRGRSSIRGGGAAEAKEEGEKFYEKPLKILRTLTGWINPFTYKYDLSFKNSLPGILERPGQKYRLGLTREPAITKFADQNRSPLSTESVNYSLSSGFTLLGGIRTDVAYRNSVNTDLVTQGVRYENTNTSWPDLSIRIQPFKTLPIIKPVVNKLIDIFSPKTGYTRQTRDKFNLDGNFLNETSTSISYSPLISLTLKLHRSVQVTGAYTLLRDNSFRYNQTTGEFQAETRTVKKTIALSTKYSFSAPGGIGIPLLGRLRFNSTMSIEVNVKINSDLSETANAGKPFVANSDKSDISISPRLSYQFSSKIKGGVTGRWQDSKDERRALTNHIRELQIWTEIQF